MEKGNWDKLIRFSDWWSHKNLHKFPYWTRCDIKHEVILAYFDIKHRYNPSKGGLNSFLSNSIWDPVFRSYAKQRDIQISRPGQVRGGPTVKRIYTDRLFFVEKYPEIKVLKKKNMSTKSQTSLSGFWI